MREAECIVLAKVSTSNFYKTCEILKGHCYLVSVHRQVSRHSVCHRSAARGANCRVLRLKARGLVNLVCKPMRGP